MKNCIIVLGLMLFMLPSAAQNKNAKLEFEVAGICGMCKKRIEKAALSTKGVKYASWSVETHMLSLILDERKTDALTVKKNLAAVGHSTQDVETTEEAYDKLDACCKYNDPKVVEDHK